MNMDNLKDWRCGGSLLKAIPHLGKKHTQMFIFRSTWNIFWRGRKNFIKINKFLPIRLAHLCDGTLREIMESWKANMSTTPVFYHHVLSGWVISFSVALYFSSFLWLLQLPWIPWSPFLLLRKFLVDPSLMLLPTDDVHLFLGKVAIIQSLQIIVLLKKTLSSFLLSCAFVTKYAGYSTFVVNFRALK